MIKKINQFCRTIDQLIFKQLDVIISRPEYQKITDKLGQLEENQQKIVNQSITFILILFPLLLVIIFTFKNISVKNENRVLQEILIQIQKYNFKNNEFNHVSQGNIAIVPIDSQESLQTKIKTMLSSKSIAADKVSVLSFSDVSSSKHLKLSESDIRFTEMTMSEFTNLLTMLTQMEKFKILQLTANKNTSTQKLGGTLKLLHMAKDMGGGE